MTTPCTLGGLESPEYGGLPVSGVLGQEFLELGLESWLGFCPNDRLDDLAAPEDLHGRDGGDLILHRGLRVVINVKFHDVDFLRVLCRNLVQNGRYGAAGPTPFGPEVHHDGLVAPEHLGVEVLVCHISCAAHLCLLGFSGRLRRCGLRRSVFVAVIRGSAVRQEQPHILNRLR